MSSSHSASLPLRTFSGATELITPPPSSTIPNSTQNDARLPFLDVPPILPRRPSLASTFSEVSELSYLSHNFQDDYMPTTSNASRYATTSDHSPRAWRQRLYLIYLQNYGALLVLASQFFGSAMNVATRLLEQPGAHGAPMHPFQILFVRQSLTALFCTGYAMTTKSIPYFPLGPPDRNVRLLLVSRGLCGFFGVFGIYFSLVYLPLSEATVLTFLAPILTCYLCAMVLSGQTFSRQQQVAGLVSLFGVIIIARPISLFMGDSATPSTGTGVENGIPPNSVTNNGTTTTTNPGQVPGPFVPTPSQHLFAIGIAMVGVVGATGALTSIRAIGTKAHAFISVNYFSVLSSVVSLIALLLIPSVSFRLPGNMQEWALLFSLGVCGFLLQSLLTMGLAYGGPTSAQLSKSEVPQHQVNANMSEEDVEMQSRPGPSALTPSRHMKSKPATPSGLGTRATSMLYTQMLFALTADRIFFGSVPDIWSWVGSGLILVGAIWVAAATDSGKANGEDEAKFDGGNGEECPSVATGLLRVKSRGDDNIPVENGNSKMREEEQIGLLTEEQNVDDEVDDRLRR